MVLNWLFFILYGVKFIYFCSFVVNEKPSHSCQNEITKEEKWRISRNWWEIYGGKWYKNEKISYIFVLSLFLSINKTPLKKQQKLKKTKKNLEDKSRVMMCLRGCLGWPK